MSRLTSYRYAEEFACKNVKLFHLLDVETNEETESKSFERLAHGSADKEC